MPMHRGRIVEVTSSVNLRLRSSLKEQAKSLGLDMSQSLETLPGRGISRRKQEARLAG